MRKLLFVWLFFPFVGLARTDTLPTPPTIPHYGFRVFKRTDVSAGYNFHFLKETKEDTTLANKKFLDDHFGFGHINLSYSILNLRREEIDSTRK